MKCRSHSLLQGFQMQSRRRLRCQTQRLELSRGLHTAQSLVDKAKAEADTREKFLPGIKDCGMLGKKQLSLFVMGSAGAGFLMCGTPFILPSFAAVNIGTLLCSFSANSFNQIYETKTDKKMFRTRLRPMPSGRVSFNQGLRFALVSGFLGVGVLATTGPLPAILGLSNIVLYAGVYTPMKRRSEWNTWVGSLVGAIPPLIGVAASPNFGTTTMLEGTLLASLLFFWQFPHFFALAYMNKDDYERGGHKMIPVADPTGSRTSNLILGYTFALSAVPFAAYAVEATSVMFPLESVLFNGYMLHKGNVFRKNRTKQNARKVFLVSLWNLPLALGLMILHKKGMFDTDEYISLGPLEDYLNSMRSLGKSLCLHETAKPKVDSKPQKEQMVFCPK